MDVVKDVLSILVTLSGAIAVVWLVIKPGLEKRIMTSAAAAQYKLDRNMTGDAAHVALLMEERREAKSEIAELRKEIAELRDQMADMREQMSATVVQKTEQQKQYDTLTKQHADIMKNNADLRRENLQLHDENAQLKAQIEIMNHKISKLTQLIIEIKPEYENILADTNEFLAVAIPKKL